ncbi:hypothetical protein CAOG_08984 [Capsaspora owczarzaki ATCC 30864]|nr:hypothetical protein CAOG_08984 [Capsaspora owczarzaki ATCC 30864]|eukprot:XP_011270662.1 hypothetical protein CAOG_08984 [Capsaspora owczarzaki ATCC 30864]
MIAPPDFDHASGAAIELLGFSLGEANRMMRDFELATLDGLLRESYQRLLSSSSCNAPAPAIGFVPSSVIHAFHRSCTVVDPLIHVPEALPQLENWVLASCALLSGHSNIPVLPAAASSSLADSASVLGSSAARTTISAMQPDLSVFQKLLLIRGAEMSLHATRALWRTFPVTFDFSVLAVACRIAGDDVASQGHGGTESHASSLPGLSLAPLSSISRAIACAGRVCVDEPLLHGRFGLLVRRWLRTCFPEAPSEQPPDSSLLLPSPSLFAARRFLGAFGSALVSRLERTEPGLHTPRLSDFFAAEIQPSFIAKLAALDVPPMPPLNLGRSATAATSGRDGLASSATTAPMLSSFAEVVAAARQLDFVTDALAISLGASPPTQLAESGRDAWQVQLDLDHWVAVAHFPKVRRLAICFLASHLVHVQAGDLSAPLGAAQDAFGSFANPSIPAWTNPAVASQSHTQLQESLANVCRLLPWIEHPLSTDQQAQLESDIFALLREAVAWPTASSPYIVATRWKAWLDAFVNAPLLLEIAFAIILQRNRPDSLVATLVGSMLSAIAGNLDATATRLDFRSSVAVDACLEAVEFKAAALQRSLEATFGQALALATSTALEWVESLRSACAEATTRLSAFSLLSEQQQIVQRVEAIQATLHSLVERLQHTC